MTPTMELRFVEREIEMPELIDPESRLIEPAHIRRLRILQQKWIDDGGYSVVEEWRDVPVVKEAK